MSKVKDLTKIEFLEKKYFDQVKIFLNKNFKYILEGFSSRYKIFDDWNLQFKATSRKGYDASNLDIGSERILYHVFSLIGWKPNSSPVSSDLFFETKDAFIHIDVKTVLISNKSDFHGLVNIGRNQTSYMAHKNYKTRTGKSIVFKPNLPKFYNIKKPNEKACLTYAIQIIHDNKKENIIAILLISIPNGKLFKIYGNKIIRRGKSGYSKKREVKDFRFAYHVNPYFVLLPKSPLRVVFIHFDNSQNRNITKKDVIRFEL